MKNMILVLVLFLGTLGNAQEDAWVYFADKQNAQFYFDNPLEMLSQRSLDRRTLQNIPLDNLDIPIHQPYIDQISGANVTVMAQSKWLNAVHVRGSEANINALLNNTFVASVDFADNSLDIGNRKHSEIDEVSKTSAVQVDFPYGNSGNQIQMLNGHLLHQQDFTGSGKIIAVMDAGFPQVDVVQPFQRLWDNNLILGGYNFVANSTDIYTSNNHGTLVLSTMGGYTENQLVGTAPDASYYLFITEDITSENPVEESYWVEAAEVADSLGVDVINTSLGYMYFDNPAYDYTYEDMDGITTFIARGADIAFSRGMIVVSSAGNFGNSDEPHINTPADAINVLTVGAVNAQGNYASFSAIGPSFDGRVKPDVVAQGQSSVVANTSGNITTSNGTSFSGPIIAGMVASLWQALPNKTNAEIMQLIKESSHLFAAPTNQLGYGKPDFSAALANGLSVAEYSINSAIAYPNPASQHLAFNFNSSNGTVSFYNQLGQLITDREVFPNHPIVIDEFSAGIYLYRLTAGDTVHTGKIIKTE